MIQPRANAPERIIGIDVGGTKIAAGLISFPDGLPLARRGLATSAQRGGRAVLDDVLRVAGELAQHADSPPRAIGVGVCELVRGDGTIASANCIRWQDLGVAGELASVAPAWIEADVRAGAWAEALFGAGQGLSTFVYITIGTGISCCLVVEGRPYLGARGLTGTMASSPLSIACESCGLVGSRTLEALAAGPGLVARFNALGQGSVSSGQEVLAAARAGNSSALQIVNSALDGLAAQIGLLVGTLDPEALIVGGGLGLGLIHGDFADRFQQAIRRHIWSPLQRDLPIVPAATGTDAGWIGAAAAAWVRLEGSR